MTGNGLADFLIIVGCAAAVVLVMAISDYFVAQATLARDYNKREQEKHERGKS